ncbi:MAG: glycosyltransferase, partial [Myxococcota bacterium]|nr:glycosyltransferase [Myxococcota bacterium]
MPVSTPMDLRLSVVVPTLNEAPCIGTVLEGLLDQAGVDELLVVDGGSTDGTVEIVEALDVDADRATVASQRTLGEGGDRQVFGDFRGVFAQLSLDPADHGPGRHVVLSDGCEQGVEVRVVHRLADFGQHVTVEDLLDREADA